MLDKIQQWLANSKELTQISKDPYKSNFEYELKLRQKLVYSTQSIEEYEVTFEKAVGTYKLMGQNPDTSSCYIGTVEIEYDDVDESLIATWYIAGATHFAYGMKVSSNIIVFNFAYMDPDENAHTGLVAYTFLSPQIVQGRWIEEGFKGEGIEELRKLDDDESDYNDNHDSNFGFSLN